MQAQQNAGGANLARSQQEANQTPTLAQAEADRTRLLGEGEAGKIIGCAAADAERVTKVGLAEAEAIKSQVEGLGRSAVLLEKSKVDVVPKIAISGSDGGSGGASLLQALMTLVLSDKLELPIGGDLRD